MRLSLILLACLALMSACGFSPVYGDRSAGAAPYSLARQLAAIDVGLIADRPGQVLRNDLIRQLGSSNRRAAALYRLEIDLTEQEQQLDVKRNATSTRANLRITAQYTLIQVTDGTVLLSETTRSLNSFTIQKTIKAVYSTIVAREDARYRGLQTVATRIVNRISLLFSDAIGPGGKAG